MYSNFIEEEVQMIYKQTKVFSNTILIRKMHIETTMCYHFKPPT